MAEQDHYKVLGVAPGADATAVKAAWKKAAKAHHPDRAGAAARTAGQDAKGVAAAEAAAAKAFKRAQSAWATLGDPIARQLYDGTRTAGGGGGSNGRGQPRPRQERERYTNWDDLRGAHAGWQKRKQAEAQRQATDARRKWEAKQVAAARAEFERMERMRAQALHDRLTKTYRGHQSTVDSAGNVWDGTKTYKVGKGPPGWDTLL